MVNMFTFSLFSGLMRAFEGGKWKTCGIWENKEKLVVISFQNIVYSEKPD